MWAVQLLLTTLVLTGAQQEERAARLYAEGVDAYNTGNLERAVELLEQAARFNRDVPDYRYHLGLAYLKVGRAKEAARELESTLGMMGMSRETRLKEPMVLVQAGLAYLQMGNLRAARLRIEDALARDDSLLDAHYVLGLVAKEEGNEEEAAKHFQSVLDVDRDHPEANLAQAEWLEKQGEPALARENLLHASHGTNDNFEILMALGALSFRVGDLDEAEEAFAQARDRRPGDDDASFNLGTVRLAQGELTGTIEALEPLVNRGSPHNAAAFNLASAFQQSGRYEEARSLLEALLERDGDFEGAAFSLALVAEAMEDYDRAESAYRDVLKNRPDFLPAFLNFAALLEKLERRHEALEVLEQALELPMEEDQARAIREAIASLG